MQSLSFTVVIPARYASSRLPGKPLLDIAGKPMIYHTWKQAQQAGASRVIVATDDVRIADAVTAFGGEVCMTKTTHSSGTERLMEVVEKLGLADDEIVVNVQGDEPLIPPVIIHQVAENLATQSAKMATLGVLIDELDELFNPNVVKAVKDKNGNALYFSRAPIPWQRDNFAQEPKVLDPKWQAQYLRHIGLYAYRAGFIKQYVAWDASPLEQIESLEQLRVLWHGEKIHIALAKEVPAVGVDTAEDLEKVRQILA
ncbi:3-deoxy-manno-octulosonate cytidylyltransferase [Actinobacillus delphinicola]|uniref:3-deoxy-manno-octulosonate cytidylyltransferase n=1 Tax=Actinobacillus delphinicola TaxID=51161 RepID=UPI002441602F|nr:3-deoxy-manno-octulosonate cytidylyltransferase [Actinobacillus delphinicola]MDG6898009.1 3-deoxy-manno-octulosonate cytidylyltransferase [Actinobacillus delphinicola]